MISLKVWFDSNIDSLTKDLDKAASKTAKLGDAFKSVGQDLIGFSVVAGAFAASTLKVAGDFEASFNQINAVLQPTKKELAELESVAKQIGSTTKFSATEASQAILMLGKNGLNTTQILGGALKATTNLSLALGSELAPTADLITDVMNQFGVEAKNLDSVINQLSGVTIASKFGFDDLRLAFAQAGGVAGQVGLNFQDFALGIAATSSAFASGSDAGTSFKTFITNLVPKTNEAKEAIKAMGLNFFDASGQMLPIRDIAQQLQTAFSGLSDAQRNQAATTIFGQDAMRTALMLAKEGAAGLDKYKESIDKVKASDLAMSQQQGFNYAMTELKSTFEGLQLAIADSGLLEFGTKLIKIGTGLIQTISGLPKPVLAFSAAIGGLVIIIPPLLIGIGSLTSLLPALAAGFAILTGPIGLAVVAVVALGAAIIYFWDDIKKYGTKALNWLQSAFEGMKTEFKLWVDTFSAFGDAIAKGDFSGAAKAFEGFGKKSNEAFKKGFDSAKIPEYVAQGGGGRHYKVDTATPMQAKQAPTKTIDFSKPEKTKVDTKLQDAIKAQKELRAENEKLGLSYLDTSKSLGTFSERLQDIPFDYVRNAMKFPKIELPTDSAQKMLDIYKEYGKQLAKITEQNKLFGNSTELARQKQDLLKQTMLDLSANGLPANSAQMQNLLELYREAGVSAIDYKGALNELSQSVFDLIGSQANLSINIESIDAVFEKTKAGLLSLKEVIKQFGANSILAGANLVSAFTDFSNAQDDLAKKGDAIKAAGLSAKETEEKMAALKKESESLSESFKNTAHKIIKSLIAQGVAAIVSNTLAQTSSFSGPLAIPIAAAAGTAAAALFSSVIPAFAKGNVAKKPIVGLFGEYAGAAQNPEITTPQKTMQAVFDNSLDSFFQNSRNLQGVLSGGAIPNMASANEPIVMETRISGEDIFVVQKRYANRVTRQK